MKIVSVIDTLRVGGPGKVLLTQILSLRDSVESWKVVTFRRRGVTDSDFSRALAAEGIDEIVLEESAIAPLRPVRSLVHLIRDLEPDIVEAHGYKANFFLALVTRRSRMDRAWRWVGWVHGYTSENPKILFYNSLERWAVTRADLTVFVSRSLRKWIRRPLRNWKVVANSVAADYDRNVSGHLNESSSQPWTSESKMILVVGRYSREKGQDRIPRIAAELSTRRQDFRFLLVGEGPAERHIRFLIKRYKVGHLVELHPFESNIRPFYRAATICVLPSRREGLPNVVLESLAMGCPLVSVDVGGVKEVVTPGVEALVVPQGDQRALVDAIDTALDDADLRSELSAAGRERVRDSFLCSKRALKVQGLYRNLLEEKAGIAGTTDLRSDQ